MKRILFAVAVVALSAAVSAAQEVPVVTAPATSMPIIVGTAGTPAMQYPAAQPQRRGLFGRLRNRNATPTYSTPVMTAPATPVQMGTPMPQVAPQPQPMPQPMPMPGAKTDSNVMMPTTGAVLQATGNVPPGIYTTTDGTVVQVSGTMSTTTPMPGTTMTPVTDGGVMQAGYTEPAQPQRRGLFGRMRNR